MRLIAATAELAKPYIDVNIEGQINSIEYELHGCLESNKVVLFIIPLNEYNITDNNIPAHYLKETHASVKCFMSNLLTNSTNSYFNVTGYHNSVAILKTLGVDYDLLSQDKPEPNVPPQSHLIKVRSEKNYKAENDNYILKGNDQFYSNPVIITTVGKLIEIDDHCAYLLSKNNSLLYLEQFTEVISKENENTVNYTIESGLNIHIFDEVNYTSDWLFEISLNFLINKSQNKVKRSEIDHEKMKENKLPQMASMHIINKNATLNDIDVNQIANCDIFQINDETYYLSCYILPIPYKIIKTYLLGSLVYIDLSYILKDLHILNLFTIDNILQGKPVNSKELICYKKFNKATFNETVQGVELKRVTNLLWDIKSEENISFDHFSTNGNQRVKFNDLNVIGKKINVGSDKCILTDRYYMNDRVEKLFRGEYTQRTISKETYNYIIFGAVGFCAFLLLTFIYCKFCRSTIKVSGSKTYRELEIGTSQQDF
jgi:hypothetical protein